MSLLDELARNATNAVQAHGGDWVQRAVEAGQHEVADKSDLVRLPSLAALSILGEHREALGTTSGHTFALVVAHLALGKDSSAELLWLRDSATFEERMAALDAAHDAVIHDRSEKAAAWAEVREVALKVLAAAGKAAVPLLLAAI